MLRKEGGLSGSSLFFKSEVAALNQQNRSLTEKLCNVQKQLLEERNKSLPNPVANETALFEAENKVEELKATIVCFWLFKL